MLKKYPAKEIRIIYYLLYLLTYYRESWQHHYRPITFQSFLCCSSWLFKEQEWGALKKSCKTTEIPHLISAGKTTGVFRWTEEVVIRHSPVSFTLLSPPLVYIFKVQFYPKVDICTLWFFKKSYLHCFSAATIVKGAGKGTHRTAILSSHPLHRGMSPQLGSFLSQSQAGDTRWKAEPPCTCGGGSILEVDSKGNRSRYLLSLQMREAGIIASEIPKQILGGIMLNCLGTGSISERHF